MLRREEDGRDPEHLRGFLQAMSGVSLIPARAIAAKFPWERYQSFADIGTAQGCLPVQLALAHEHLIGSRRRREPSRGRLGRTSHPAGRSRF